MFMLLSQVSAYTSTIPQLIFVLPIDIHLGAAAHNIVYKANASME